MNRLRLRLIALGAAAALGLSACTADSDAAWRTSEPPGPSQGPSAAEPPTASTTPAPTTARTSSSVTPSPTPSPSESPSASASEAEPAPSPEAPASGEPTPPGTANAHPSASAPFAAPNVETGPGSGATANGTPLALPPTSGVFDYQLGGPSEQVSAGGPRPAVVVRDAEASPAPGAYNVCYVNGFQTQPGDEDFWLARPELLITDAQGAPVVDPDWPDEFILNPNSEQSRQGILAVLSASIRGCAYKGFQAVELDNLDTFTRIAGVSEEGALQLAKAYVDLGHELGLAVAQKNSAEIVDAGRHRVGFDFAVAESCGAWNECDAYRAAYGEHVLQIEYREALGENGRSFEQVCASRDRAPLTILRDRDLVPVGSSGRVYRQC